MKKRLRLLAWFLTLTMLCELLPLGTFAQSDIGQGLAQAVAQRLEEENGEAVATGKCGDNLTWSLSSDGTLTISGTGDMDDYLYTYGFDSRYPPWATWTWPDSTLSITKIIISTGVTSIGNYAFRACSSSTSIVIPDSIASIGQHAFQACSSLTSIVIPDAVTSIDESTFYGCSSLTSIVIPDTVTSIGESAFYGCSSLNSLVIPDSVTSISKSTFYGCNSLTSIIIPDSVVFIGDHAFSYCHSLASIVIPDTVPSIGKLTFYDCSSLTSIVIPDSITSISQCAFQSCSSLTDVYYSGTQEQWKAIDIDQYGNSPLLNATIHCSDDDGKGFTFNRDNLSFLNSPKDFFTGEELNYWYYKYNHPKISKFTDFFNKHPEQYASIHLSQEKFKQLTNRLSYSASNYFKSKVYNDSIWGGSCFGMVLVSALHYTSPDRLPFSQMTSTGLTNSSHTYELPSPAENTEVEDLVNYYWASQFLPTQYKIWCTYLYNVAHDCNGVLNEIITALSQNIPVFAVIPCHAIMLLDVKEVHEDYYVLGIYDPNETDEQTLILYRTPEIDENGDGQLKIQYKDYDYIRYYILSSDSNILDTRNYFNIDKDYETSLDYNDAHISISVDGTYCLYGNQYYYRTENGNLVEKSSNIHVISPSSDLENESPSSAVELIFPKPSSSDDLHLELSSEQSSTASMILNDTMLAISADKPVTLTYNEEARTVDVTAENPTDVNILMTQNDTTTEWPWHSWAIDTTGTTEFHAELKDDGLHLSGDGIANANYATENSDTDVVDSGTIPDKAENVIITKKADDDSKTEIKGNTSTDPDKRTVTVVNGKITAINDMPTTDSITTLGDAAEGTKITITADDKSAESKTFRKWSVKAGNVTLDSTESSETFFTMGTEPVRIEAQYDSDTPVVPVPTPGGGDSGSGGSSSGGGAAVVLGVGVAAAVTAGVIMTMPVEVQGRVELADHTAVPGAKISLLQNGSVVVQTTADESGHFSLKAKRGSYELTVVYTDPNGQFIQKTTSLKAPAKDLVITF